MGLRTRLYLLAVMLPLGAYLAGLFDAHATLTYTQGVPVSRVARQATPQWTRPCWKSYLQHLVRETACERVHGRMLITQRKNGVLAMRLLVHGHLVTVQWLAHHEPSSLPKRLALVDVTGPTIRSGDARALIAAAVH